MENESREESEGRRGRERERERFSCCNAMLNSNMHRSRHGNRARREASHGAEKVCVCFGCAFALQCLRVRADD